MSTCPTCSRDVEIVNVDGKGVLLDTIPSVPVIELDRLVAWPDASKRMGHAPPDPLYAVHRCHTSLLLIDERELLDASAQRSAA
jgi:hypothetical protein